MKKMRLLLVMLFPTLLLGCNQSKKEGSKLGSKNDTLFATKSTSMESLSYYTADTILNINPELVELLEPLYQHAKGSSVLGDVQVEESWMAEYRSEICEYYDRKHSKDDAISDFAKAERVMNEAEKLYMAYQDQGSIGVIIQNDILHSFTVFREYTLLSQMISHCSNSQEKEQIYIEWDSYKQLEEKFFMIVTNLANMYYWGGNAGGLIASGCRLQATKARLEMYRALLAIVGNSLCKYTEAHKAMAEKNLADCVHAAIKRAKAVLDEDDEIDSRFMDDEHKQRFIETLEDTKADAKELPQLIPTWKDSMLKSEFFKPNNSVERVVSKMLLEWADIVSALE